MAFLSTPVTYVLLRFCLALEWTGLCQGSWVVARIHRKIVKFKRDEVYIGIAEERATKAITDPMRFDGDDEQKYDVVPGHMYPGVPTLPPDFKGVNRSMEEIEDLEKDLKEKQQEIEARLAHLEVQKDKTLGKSVIIEQNASHGEHSE